MQSLAAWLTASSNLDFQKVHIVAKFVSWIRDAVQQAVDPHKKPRQARLARLLEGALAKERQAFSMPTFVQEVDHTSRDLGAAKRILFHKLLNRAWDDGKITPAEQKALKSYAEQIELPTEATSTIYRETAMQRFAIVFSQAMEDGVLDAHEIASLENVTRSVGMGLQEFVRGYFQNESERFLAGLFTACTEGGVLSDDAWNRLVTTAGQLGFKDDDISRLIQPQAKRFIEHVLVDAKSDGTLSETEDAVLIKLVRSLKMSQDFCEYVESQVASLRTIRRASKGDLSTLPHPPGIALRAGELVFFHKPARWRYYKDLKSGPVDAMHFGFLTITDYRLLFSSETKSLEARLGRIIGHWGNTGVMSVQIAGKPEAQFSAEENDPVMYAILEAAISLANQTRVAKLNEGPSRHIPREIRQRIWQRYGGQCADCGANQYLEFDHIVPVARGGSNSEANVQLLCRNCNQKKSDRI